MDSRLPEEESCLPDKETSLAELEARNADIVRDAELCVIVVVRVEPETKMSLGRRVNHRLLAFLGAVFIGVVVSVLVLWLNYLLPFIHP